MRALRIVFGLLLAGAAVVLALRARTGVEADLYGLVDSHLGGGALGEIATGLANQGRVLLEGDDFEALKPVADRVARLLRQPPRGGVRDFLRVFDSHKAGLLAPETRERLLAGRYREVADAALARLYSPVPRLLSVKDDPFLLATEYVTALQTGLAEGWTMREGYPVCEREGRTFLLLTLNLAGVPVSVLSDCVARGAATVASGDATVKIWCGGAPFHSAVASGRSKREIGVLTGVSLAGVLLLGCLLFRSLRFLPALMLAQGAGFLVAAAALFLFFPKPHVLTFVFGTSLIGLSVDYVYHARISGDVRRILRPLTYSLVTTVACFAPLLFAEVVVLRQMAVFSISGLIAAYATVTLLPAGRGTACEVPATAPRRTAGRRAWAVLWICFVLLLAGVFRLTVVDDPAAFYRPNDYLAAGERRMAELSPGRAQRFAFVPGRTLQEALEREEAAGVKGLSALVPSLRRQRENAALVARLVQAEGSNYTAKTGLRMPQGERLDFLDPEALAEGPLRQMVRVLRVAGGLVSPLPQGVPSPAGVEVFEPRVALQNLFRHFTDATLKLLLVSFAAFLLVLAVVFRLRMLRYLLPVGLALLATAGALGWMGIPLTFFTLLCFFVLAGLGVDYVVFQISDPSPATRRTVLFAFLTSFVGLGMLAFTSFPVTRTMGVTFAVGLFFAWVAAWFTGVVLGGGDASPRLWHEQREQSAGRLRLLFMWCLYAWFGKNLLKLATVPVMVFIYPFARPARRALRSFYAVLAEYENRARPHRSVFRHLLGFAWSLADKTDACTLQKDLPTMTVRADAGWEAFQSLVRMHKGAFLISTHVGTIEVLPALAAGRVPQTVPHVHAFQQMGHDAVFTSLFMRHFDARTVTLHDVGGIGVETAVQMQEAIGRGELVLMAGDRVSAGSRKTLRHDFLGRPCRWPKGVFVFAKLMESPIFFVSCVRTGWNAYECHFARFNPASATSLLGQYVAFLESETRAHPEQWYQFYDFFGDMV